MSIAVSCQIPLRHHFTSEIVEWVIKQFIGWKPDAPTSLECVELDYASGDCLFLDVITHTQHRISGPRWVKAFLLLYTDKWPEALPVPPVSNLEATWSSTFFDRLSEDETNSNFDLAYEAFIELAIYGEARPAHSFVH